MTESYSLGVMREDGTPLFMFDTDRQEFARGFEAGGLFVQLAVNPGPFEAEIDLSNSNMLVRMAEATERAYVAHELDNEKLLVRVMPKGGRPPEPKEEE